MGSTKRPRSLIGTIFRAAPGGDSPRQMPPLISCIDGPALSPWHGLQRSTIRQTAPLSPTTQHSAQHHAIYAMPCQTALPPPPPPPPQSNPTPLPEFAPHQSTAHCTRPNCTKLSSATPQRTTSRRPFPFPFPSPPHHTKHQSTSHVPKNNANQTKPPHDSTLPCTALHHTMKPQHITAQSTSNGRSTPPCTATPHQIDSPHCLFTPQCTEMRLILPPHTPADPAASRGIRKLPQATATRSRHQKMSAGPLGRPFLLHQASPSRRNWGRQWPLLSLAIRPATRHAKLLRQHHQQRPMTGNFRPR